MPQQLARHYRTGASLLVAWSGGRVRDVSPAPDDRAATALWLGPALLDLQVNGFRGDDFGRSENLPRVAARLAEHGVARFLPTVVTAAPDAMRGALRAVGAALSADAALSAAIPGVHVEGPYISDLDGPRGAHPRAHVRDPDWSDFEELQEAAGGRIRMLTLAPERPGAIEFIARLAGAGVIPALGHTAADGETIRRAAAAGAALSTHLGNGLAATLDRHRNPVWPQLACRSLRASFIADGHHLPADALTAMVAAKGTARSLLVSDCVAQAGLAPGRHPGVGGGEVDVLPGGRIQLAGTPYLAGSGATLEVCVGWAAASGAADLPDALDMASVEPARLLGLPAGSLDPGADLMLYRLGTGGTLTVEMVSRAGEVVHDASAGRP